ncbi:MAG: hypothetical protein ACF8MJ_03415 [Phycisphaerales bacterium JB050]
MKKIAIAAAALTALTGLASAEIVQIDIVGSVDFGGVNIGQWADVNPGDSAVMSFQVDTNNFLDSTNFPTRGYEIISSSFALTLDGITGGMANPYPNDAAPYFIIRDNDPAVDGFYLAEHPDQFPIGVATDEPAQIGETFRALFSATYGGDRLDSLDILGAVGTYDFTGLQVFNWGLEDGPFQPMGFIFDSFTISVVPAPSSAALLTMGALTCARRRRAHA